MAVETLPALLTIEEAGALLRIGRSRAYEWAASGRMPGVVKLGRSLRVSRRHLMAWVDELASGDEEGANAASAAPWEMRRVSGHTPTGRS